MRVAFGPRIRQDLRDTGVNPCCQSARTRYYPPMRTRIPALTLLFLLSGIISLVVWAGEKAGDAPRPDAPPAVAGYEVATADAGDEEMDGGVGDAGPEEAPTIAAAPPPPPVVDETQLPPAEEEERLPYSKGDMEVGIGLGLAGDGNETYLGVGGRFAYYVIHRLAPGIDVQYSHVFSDNNTSYEYPESMTLLPFLKFVITQKKVAPYVFVTAGYEIEWGSISAVNAWILGLGGGVHIRVAKHFSVNVELGALHYWYADKKIYWHKDSDMLRNEETGQQVYGPACKKAGDCGSLAAGAADPEEGLVLVDSKGNRFHCQDPDNCPAQLTKDKKDVNREWYFPLVTIGFSFHF